LLEHVNNEGRKIIHSLADNNHSDAAPCLTAIITASQKLNMSGYVNSREEHYHSTPLMFAARRGSIEHLKILLENKADANAKAQNGQTAFDLAKFTDPKIAIPKMRVLLELHAESRSKFNKENRNFLSLYPEALDAKNEKHALLNALLEINIDLSFSHHQGQISAFKLMCQHEKRFQSPEDKIFVSNLCRQIDYPLILKGDLEPKIKKLQEPQQEKDKKQVRGELKGEDKEINELLDNLAQDIARSPSLTEQHKTALVQAAFLLTRTNDPVSQKDAAVLCSLLISCAPELALKGLNAVNKDCLDEANQFLLMRRTLLALAQIQVNNLGLPEKSSFSEWFNKPVAEAKGQRNLARKKLPQFMNCIDRTTDLEGLLTNVSTFIDKNPNPALAVFYQDIRARVGTKEREMKLSIV
jgi:hypothetical protein